MSSAPTYPYLVDVPSLVKACPRRDLSCQRALFTGLAPRIGRSFLWLRRRQSFRLETPNHRLQPTPPLRGSAAEP